MDDIFIKMIIDYIEENYMIFLDDIKFKDAKISDKSFKVKEHLTDKIYDLSTLIKETNLIFGDGETTSTINDVIDNWVKITLEKEKYDIYPTVDKMKNYFRDNVIMKLGARNWQTFHKDGKPFILKTAIDDLEKLEVDWIDVKIVKHFYNQWYDEEVIKYSERIMGIS